MGKVVATYLVHVTLREADRDPGVEGGQVDLNPPTNDDLQDEIAYAVNMEWPAFKVTATSERTDN